MTYLLFKQMMKLTLVITTAIDAVKTRNVIVIGEGTDILLLLLNYYNLDLTIQDLFYK